MRRPERNARGEDDTPRELLATAYWAHDAALMAGIAEATGRPEQAAGYRALRAKIGAAFAARMRPSTPTRGWNSDPAHFL